MFSTNRMVDAEPLCRRWRSTSTRTAPTTPPSRITSGTWPFCSRPLTAWQQPSRCWHAPFACSRNSGDRPATNTCTNGPRRYYYRQLLTMQKLAEPEIAARIKAANEGTDKLPPIVLEVGASSQPVQACGGRAVISRSPKLGAAQAVCLFSRPERTDHTASRSSCSGRPGTD